MLSEPDRVSISAGPRLVGDQGGRKGGEGSECFSRRSDRGMRSGWTMKGIRLRGSHGHRIERRRITGRDDPSNEGVRAESLLLALSRVQHPRDASVGRWIAKRVRIAVLTEQRDQHHRAAVPVYRRNDVGRRRSSPESGPERLLIRQWIHPDFLLLTPEKPVEQEPMIGEATALRVALYQRWERP